MNTTTLTKFRNGVTNLGVMTGFATNTLDGGLRIRQTASAADAVPLRRDPQARPAEYDHEPVFVIFRMVPTPGTDVPTLVALHVTRLSKDRMPKPDRWFNPQVWASDMDFVPYYRRSEGQGWLREIVDSLADTLALPQWAIDAAEGDSELAPMLYEPLSSNRLTSRLLLTCQVAAIAKAERGDGSGLQPGFLTLHAIQPGEDDVPMRLYAPISCPGYNTLIARMRRDFAMSATLSLQVGYRTQAVDGVPNVGLYPLLLDMMQIDEPDIRPDLRGTKVFKNPPRPEVA